MEILRIVSAAIAFTVCTFEGCRRSSELKARVKFLAETELLLERFSVGIRCLGKTSDELLENEQGQFAVSVKSFAADCGIREAWERACDALPKNREETALLRGLGRTLGTADKESTLNLLERCILELTSLKAAAEAEYARRGKAVFQVGTLCGIGAAILII